MDARPGASSLSPSLPGRATSARGSLRLWRRWVLATTLGELLGFAAPALAGAAAGLGLGDALLVPRAIRRPPA